MYPVTPTLVGHEACFCGLQLLHRGVTFLRFMLLEHRLHACLVELEGLPLIGLLQAFDQCIQLQARHLLTQPLTQAGAQAVGQVMVVAVGQGDGGQQA